MTGVSEPTLIRFSRSYGYSGIPGLKLATAMSLATEDRANSAMLEPSVLDKVNVHARAKLAIARAALPLVQADRSIVLDSGSTVLNFAKQLAEVKPLSILTTGLAAIFELCAFRQHELMIPGGVLRPDAMALSGRMVEETVSKLSFDSAYIGADSINPTIGLSTFSEEEAHLTMALTSACRRVVVLADSSKFTSPALHHICSIDKVEVIVTDSGLSSETRQLLEQSGTKLIFAAPGVEAEAST